MQAKFEIYHDGKRLTSFAPVAAMAMGPESVPIPGDITFRDNALVMTRNEEHPSGMSLMWDLGELGAYHLETTRIVARDKPYNLNVELARGRLMKIVQKQEDWNLFDFPRTEKYMVRAREAQALFAEALGTLQKPGEAAMLADQALAMSVELSDQLALFHGDLLLARRRATNALPRHVIGCRVDSTIQNQRYKDTLADHFDFAVLPMSWKQLQPQEGAFHTEAVDEWVDLLTKKRIPIIAGPLIDLSEGNVPDWMFIWEHDFDSLREMAYEYVQKVVHRYRKQVSVWNVVSGLHTNSAFSLSFEQIIELTRLLVAQVKTIQSSARTLVSVTQPYGEYHAKGGTSVPPMLYAEMVAQAGINFEAFGLEIEQGVPARGAYTRDIFQLSCLLDRFSTIGRPVFLTALGTPGRNTPDASDRSEGKLDPALAGRWKRPWDTQLQAEWLDTVFKLALSKPFIESVAWGNLADINTTLPAGGLLDDMLKPKPAFSKLQELRETFTREKAMIWSSSQRRVILALLVMMAAYLTIRLSLNRTYVSDPQPLIPPRASELQDRIDPNTAQWQELAALPVIGEKRARDIVAYREQFAAEHPGQPAFPRLEDLREIRGIGTATLIQIEPHLIFPNSSLPSTTQP